MCIERDVETLRPNGDSAHVGGVGVQASFFEKREKMCQLENEECQQDSSYNSSHIGEGSLIKPKESFESLQSSIIFTLTPIKSTQEELKLEYDALIAQRIQENCFKNMNIKYEA